MKRRQSPKVLVFIMLLPVIALIAGCQPVAPIASDDGSAAVALPTQVPEEQVPEEDAVETSIADEATSAEEMMPDAGGFPPVTIEIPALSLVIPVAPMGWESAEVEGRTTTRWVVPDDAAGWALNSARAGDEGN
ncbi:MAG: hypothetical protein ACK4SA_10430, partial [Caldilinea sp.]